VRDDSALAIEQQLDDLEAQSRARQAELRELAAALPAAMSRRMLVKQMLHSVRDAPDRGTVVKRTANKIVRTPAELLRRVRNTD
jgi:hypothetical protein